MRFMLKDSSGALNVKHKSQFHKIDDGFLGKITVPIHSSILLTSTCMSKSKAGITHITLLTSSFNDIQS